MASKSVDETGCKLRDSVEGWHTKVIHVVVSSWSDRAKKVDKSSCCIITGVKVSFCMPVFLLLMDGFFNLSAMEQPPSCYKLSEFNWMVENIRPIFDGSDVIVHAFTCLHSVWKHPNNLSNVLNSSDEFQVLEVIKCNLNLVDKVVSPLEAVLKLDQMVVSSETIDKTRSEVWNSIDRWKVWAWEMMNTPDWSQKIDKSGSSVVSSIEPVTRRPVCLFFMNGLLYFGSVENPSLINGLNKGERVMEDISPFLDGINIVLNTLTVLYGVWEHPDDSSDVFDSINEVEVLEVI